MPRWSSWPVTMVCTCPKRWPRTGRRSCRRPTTSGQLAELLLDEADVAVVPGEAFGTDGYFRLSCALGDADLEEGVSRLSKLLSSAH